MKIRFSLFFLVLGLIGYTTLDAQPHHYNHYRYAKSKKAYYKPAHHYHHYPAGYVVYKRYPSYRYGYRPVYGHYRHIPPGHLKKMYGYHHGRRYRYYSRPYYSYYDRPYYSGTRTVVIINRY